MDDQHAGSIGRGQLHFGQVDAVVDAAHFQVVAQLGSAHLGAVFFALGGGSTQVRNAGDLFHADHLVRGEVYHVAGQLAISQGGLQVVSIDQFGAGEVHQVGTLLHLGDLGRVDGAAGLVIQRNVIGHIVSLGQHFVLAGSTANAAGQAPRIFNGNEGIVAHDLHAQAAGGLVGHQRADGTQTDHAQGLAAELRTHELTLALFHQLGHISTLALQAGCPHISSGHIAAAHNQAADDQFGHSVGIGTGGVEHHDTLLGALVDRDVIHTGTGAGDGQQVVAQLHIVHGSRAHQNAVGGGLFLGHGVHISRKLGMDDIGNRIQRLNLEHNSNSSPHSPREVHKRWVSKGLKALRGMSGQSPDQGAGAEPLLGDP